MSFAQKVSVQVVTASDGSGEAFTPPLTGLISQIRYVKDGSAGFTDGVDFTITVEGTGETVWTQTNVNASATKAPRQPVHDTAGADALHAGGGTALRAPIAIANDRIRFAVASGGDTKRGTFWVVMT